MSSIVVIPAKYNSSTIPLYIDFTSQMSDGEACVAFESTIEVYSGVDPTPSAVLDGAPTLFMNTCTQVVTGGVPGVIYWLGFNATTNQGNHLIINAYLSVINSNPFQVVP